MGKNLVNPYPSYGNGPLTTETGHGQRKMKNALLLFVGSVVILVAFFPSFMKMRELSVRNDELKSEQAALIEKNKQLLAEKRRLEEDPEYLERVAREKMGLGREGEVIFRMTPAVNGIKPDK